MTKRILLVENNKSDARKIGQSLRDLGYEVVLATDGQEGLDLFRDTSPDLAVVDMLLPKVSGSELCLRLRQTPEGRDVPLVLISSIFKNMNLSRIARDRWKVDRFFEKPLDLDTFGREVDALAAEAARTRIERPSAPAAAEIPTPSDAAAGAPLVDSPADADDDADEVSGTAELVDEAAAEDSAAERQPDSGEALRVAADPDARYRTVERRTDFYLRDVPFEGTLDDCSVPEILTYLYYHEESGVLEIRSREASKKVYVRDGSPIYVESAIREESLGRMLVREGLITEEDCFLSLQNMRTYHKRQGGALVQAGVLTPRQLMDALRRQMRRKVLNLFAWFEGDYSFARKRIKAETVAEFEMSVPDLVLEGVREFYEPASIQTIFEEIRQLRLRAKDYLPFRVADLGLSDEERSLVDLADGSRSVERIVNLSSVDPSATFQVLYAMMLLGVFEGVIEEQELVEREGRPFFPDIEMLEEQAEAAARSLEESTLGQSGAEPVEIDIFGAGVSPDEPQPMDVFAPEEIVGEPEDLDVFASESDATPEEASSADDLDGEAGTDESLPIDVDVDDAAFNETLGESGDADADAEPAATDGPGLQMLEEPESTAFAELTPAQRELRDRILNDYLRLQDANHYDVMNVARDASMEEIKKVYVQLAKVYHADALGKTFDPGVVQKANEVFSRITDAYKTLVDPAKRRQYDKIVTDTGEVRKERTVANILVAENHFNRGADMLKRNDWKGAAEQFRQAIDLFPEESEYHSHLGWCAYHMPGLDAAQRFEQARELIQKAISLNPKSDVAYYFLGQIMKARGNVDQALQAFAQAIRYNRKNDQAKAALKALQYQRLKDRQAPHEQGGKDRPSLKKILTADVDLETVKKSVLKIFWS